MMSPEVLAVARSIRSEMIGIYWTLLPLVLVIMVIIELLASQPKVGEILKRVFISVLLLITFPYVSGFIASIGDSITDKLTGLNDAYSVLSELGPKKMEGSQGGGFFDLRGHFLYFLALLAYLIAYLGFFMADALTQYTWVLLEVCSPLMILCYVAPGVAGVTSSLYSGLTKVIVWKVLWLILGALLLQLAQNASYDGLSEYLSAIVLNLCIGFSMLFVPLATKSLLKDGFEGISGTLSAVPLGIALAKIKMSGGILAQKAAKTALGKEPKNKSSSLPSQNIQPRKN